MAWLAAMGLVQVQTCGLSDNYRSTDMPRECYWCESIGDTDEHVPPRCLFPEQKDSGGNYRRNLITVPACAEHNSGKSKDDEFLMAVLSAAVGGNSLAYRQTSTKVRRTFEHSPSLLDRIVLNPQRLIAVDSDGASYPVIAGRPDMPRLVRALEATARGLWYHHRACRFVGECVILPAFVSFDPAVDGGRMEMLKTLARILGEEDLAVGANGGSNPEVFVYRFGSVDQFGLIPLFMTFFEGIDVFASFIPAGVVPPHRARQASKT